MNESKRNYIQDSDLQKIRTYDLHRREDSWKTGTKNGQNKNLGITQTKDYNTCKIHIPSLRNKKYKRRYTGGNNNRRSRHKKKPVRLGCLCVCLSVSLHVFVCLRRKGNSEDSEGNKDIGRHLSEIHSPVCSPDLNTCTLIFTVVSHRNFRSLTF